MMLNVDPSNQRTQETAWGEADQDAWIPGNTSGSGGGYSNIFSDMVNGSTAKRGLPDVSIVGQNLEMYMSQDGGFVSGSSTAYAAPLWSGIIALAAQKAKHGFGWIRPLIQNIATQPATQGASRYHRRHQRQVCGDIRLGPCDLLGTPANGWTLIRIAGQPIELPLSAGP